MIPDVVTGQDSRPATEPREKIKAERAKKLEERHIHIDDERVVASAVVLFM